MPKGKPEEKMSNVAVIRKYFSEGKHGRKVEMSELKELPLEEREELGDLARIELGVGKE